MLTKISQEKARDQNVSSAVNDSKGIPKGTEKKDYLTYQWLLMNDGLDDDLDEEPLETTLECAFLRPYIFFHKFYHGGIGDPKVRAQIQMIGKRTRRIRPKDYVPSGRFLIELDEADRFRDFTVIDGEKPPKLKPNQYLSRHFDMSMAHYPFSQRSHDRLVRAVIDEYFGAQRFYEFSKFVLDDANFFLAKSAK